MQSKKKLSILLEAVEILKNEYLPKGETMKILKYENKTIKPRPNGKGYYVRYRDANGQHALYGESAEEVLEKLKKALKSAPKKKRKSPTALTLGKWWLKWIEIYKQDIKESTLLTYKTIFNCYLTKIQNTPLSEFNVFNVSSFINSIQSSRQRFRTYNYLNACFEKAVLLKLMEENPCSLIPRPKHIKENIRPLRASEQKLFLEAIKGARYETLFLVLLQEGLRIGEALALTRGDLDFENKLININKTYGKGKTTTPKTLASKRLVPMFGNVAELLQQFGNKKSNERIFPHDIKFISISFKRITESLNIFDVTTHSLRKTFATRLFELGVPALQIQQWLGHSDVLTTERIYIKIAPNSNQKWLNLADNLLNFDTQFDTQSVNL